ncbi:MAG: hypothetical protein EXR69_15640 [Myxococcales bacterium]|nr:hypothetical protein [Myxococcales bacterium]
MLLLHWALAAGGRGTETHQATLLSEAATEYWEGVRWNAPSKCAKYISDLEVRVALTQLLSDPTVRLTAATVLQALLGDEVKGDDGRNAVVLVRLEVIDLAKNRYETMNHSQHWHDVGQGWRVDTDRSPLGLDRAWVVGSAAAPAAAPPAEVPSATVDPAPVAAP